MDGRIVVFGATGYTGRLVVESMVQRGMRPVLAGRDASRLDELAREHDDLDIAQADVDEPASVVDLVDRGDVLVTTVGPFVRLGDVAVEAAVLRGAHYLDSTGESTFIRRVFEQHGPRAAAAGVGLVTAFGLDWVPGNLAAALALREAGDATRVDVGYFLTGRGGGMSGGTRASAVGIAMDTSWRWHDGRIRTERFAARARSFELRGRRRDAVSVAATEHFALPRLHPGLREVNVYLGWFGAASRGLQLASAASAAIMRVPGVRPATRALARLVPGSTGGPDAAERAATGSAIVATAHGPDGGELARVELRGVNGYTFTGRMLAWGAARVREGGLHGVGALGPVDAFGLDELEAGVREAGIERV